MPKSSIGTFERELKHILSGNKDIIDKVTISCDQEEKRNYTKIHSFPFIVVRAAASKGFADLVALRGDFSFLVEIKTSIKKEIYFTRDKGYNQKQAEDLKKECEKTGALPIYAYRLKRTKGDSWRVFSLPLNKLCGIPKLVHSRLPLLRETDKGNYIMAWNSGMKLSDFLDYLSEVLKPNL